MAVNTVYNKIGHYKLIQTGNSLGMNNGNFIPYISCYISLNPALTAAGVTSSTLPATYAGTTLLESQNGSWAMLNPPTSVVPAGATVDYAFLTWGGQYQSATVPTNNITFIDATSVSHSIAPNPAYTQVGTDGYRLFYTEGADVTTIVQNAGNGAYSVSNVHGITNFTSGLAIGMGWALVVSYTHTNILYNSVAIYSICQFNAIASTSITLPNIQTPISGSVQGRLILSAVYGDVGYPDSVYVNGIQISGPNNPANDFCNSAICNYSGNIATIGSFADRNRTTTTYPSARWEYDLTNVSISNALTNNQTSVNVFFPKSSADSTQYQMLSLEIPQNTTYFTKSVDKLYATTASTITYTLVLENFSTFTLDNVQLSDTLPNGTLFLQNSMTINGTPTTGNPIPPGVSLGNLNPNSTTTITFSVLVGSTVPSPNPIKNNAYVVFDSNGQHQNYSTNTISTTISTAILSSTKLAKSYANIGDVLTYTIPIKNTGSTTAFNIRFIDTIPNGTTLVANSLKQGAVVVGGSPNPPGVTLPNPIGAGATSTVTFQVTVLTVPTPNPILNSANQIFSYTIDNSTTPNIVGTGSSSTNTVNTLINFANLSPMIKGVDKGFATLNDILTYTITIPNTGPTSANSVVFRDTIPTGTTLVINSFKVNGVVKSGVSPAPPSGTNIGTIPAGSTFTVSFQVTVITIPSPNLVLNSSATTFTYQVNPSSTITTNGSAGSNIVTTTITRTAIITSTKSVNLANAFMGDTLTYTIGFKNTGTTLANTLTFVDTTPNGTTFVPNSVIINGVTMVGAGLTSPGVTLPNLAVGQSATLTFQVVVVTTPTPNPTTNQGTLNYSYTDASSGTNGTATNNTNIVSTYVYPGNNPFKGLDKAYSTVGDTVTYILGFIAALGVQENNVTFSDTIPTGTTFVPNSVFVNGVNKPGATITLPNGINTGTLPADSLVTVSFQVVVNTLPAINPIVNQGMVTYSDTLAVGTQTRLSNTVTTQINLANFNELTKSVDKPFTTLGDTLTYTVSFINTGNTTAENIVFLDATPTDTTFVPNSIILNGITLTGQIPDPPTGAPIGTIPVGATTTITFQVIVTALPPTNSIPNTASLTGDYIINPIMGTTISLSGNTNTVTSQVNFADLSNPIKGVDLSFADVGNTLTYTITLVNSGNTTAENVKFVDTVPDNTTFISNSITVNGTTITGVSPNPLSIPIGTLPIGSTSTVTFKVFVSTLPTTNPIPNSGVVSYDFIVNPSIPTTSTGIHPTNTVATTINHANLGMITKFVNLSYATCNATITYTISIPNTGNIDALNVVFHDTIPTGTTYIPGSLQVDGTPIGGTPDSIPIGTIPAGTTSVVTFKVQVTC